MTKFSGQIGSAASAGGVMTLGGPPTISIPAPPTMATIMAKPYIAHLYSTGMAFKALLGPLGNAPILKWSLNSGFHPITLELPSPATGISLGDLIFLSEDKGGSSAFVYGGKVESLPRIFSPGQANFQVGVAPFVAELGDSGVNLAYTAPTDLAVMIHDAVSQTAHCSMDFVSCPMTGITAINNFNNTSPLDVLNTCRKIAGSNYWWFVDQYGRTWFQPTGSAAYYTFKLGADYNSGKANQSIQDTKNYVHVFGGWNGGSGPLESIYNGVGGTLAERRQLFPNPDFPTVTDQGTLDNIAQALGRALDRVIHSIEVQAPAFGTRVVANLPGGPMMRYWEEAVNPLVEAGTGVGGLSQSGTYSSTYVGLDNEITLPSQKVVMGDLPIIGVNDLVYEIGRMIAQGSGNRSSAQSPAPAGASVVMPSGGYWAIKDLANLIRYEFGNLPLFTDARGVVSPAHFGARARDASGNLLADSVGLSNTLTSLYSTNTNNGSAGTNVTGSGSAITLMSGNFTLSRTTNVLIFSTVSAYEFQTAIGPILVAPNFTLQVDGVTPTTEGAIPLTDQVSTIGPNSATMILALPALAAGTYTARTTWTSMSGANDRLTWFAENLYVYAVGG